MDDHCRYCMTPLDPTTDCGCGCDGERIAELEAQLAAFRHAATLRTSIGCEDTCSSRVIPGGPCSCGNDWLLRLLSTPPQTGGTSDEQ